MSRNFGALALSEKQLTGMEIARKKLSGVEPFLRLVRSAEVGMCANCYSTCSGVCGGNCANICGASGSNYRSPQS